MFKLKGLGVLVLGVLVAGTPLALISCGGSSSGGGTTDAAPSQWTDPADGSDYISLGYEPQAALSDDGDAIITWRGNDLIQDRVYRVQYRGSTWSSPLKIAVTDSTSVTGTPQVAMDDHGNAVIAWIQRILPSYPVASRLFASTYKATAGTWEHPSGLSDYMSPDESSPSNVQVAMANTLRAAVVWQQFKPGGPSINNHIYAILRDNSGWGLRPTIADNISAESATRDNAGNPRVGMNDGGYVTAAWWQENPSNDIQIYESVYDAGTGVWLTATLANPLSRSETDVADQLDVAVGGGGAGVIVWDQPDGSNDTQIFKSDNRPSGYLRPDDLSQNLSVDGTDAVNPVAAMSDSGYTVVAWEQEDNSTGCSGGTCSQIFISTRGPGAAVSYSVPATLADNISPDGSDAYDTQVAVADNGDFVVVWLQNDGTYDQIFRAEMRGSTWTEPTDLTDHISTDSSDAANAHVAMDSSGKTVIVWEQNGHIFKSEYR